MKFRNQTHDCGVRGDTLKILSIKATHKALPKQCLKTQTIFNLKQQMGILI